MVDFSLRDLVLRPARSWSMLAADDLANEERRIKNGN